MCKWIRCVEEVRVGHAHQVEFDRSKSSRNFEAVITATMRSRCSVLDVRRRDGKR
jgi:hypothetical protein